MTLLNTPKARFEAWMQEFDGGADLAVSCDREDEYEDFDTQRAWAAWQAANASRSEPATSIGFLPRGWSLTRRNEGIVVAHEIEGAYFATENKDNIASLILFYLADDLMDAALPSAEVPAKGQS